MNKLFDKIASKFLAIVLNVLQRMEMIKVGDVVYLHSEIHTPSTNFARVYRVLSIKRPVSIFINDFVFTLSLAVGEKGGYLQDISALDDGIYKINKENIIPLNKFKIGDIVSVNFSTGIETMKVLTEPELWFESNTGKLMYQYGLTNFELVKKNDNFHFAKIMEDRMSPYVPRFDMWNKLNGI